jgi:hypothetical protein
MARIATGVMALHESIGAPTIPMMPSAQTTLSKAVTSGRNMAWRVRNAS